MKKRLIAFLLVLIMVLGMLPVSALAADPEYYTLTLTYDPNGGLFGTSSDVKSFSEHKLVEPCQFTIMTEEPTREGYTFQGWGAYSNATNAQWTYDGRYSTSTTITVGAKGNTKEGQTTLYAVWKANLTPESIDWSSIQITAACKNDSTHNVATSVPSGTYIKTYNYYAPSISFLPDQFIPEGHKSTGAVQVPVTLTWNTEKKLFALDTSIDGNGTFEVEDEAVDVAPEIPDKTSNTIGGTGFNFECTNTGVQHNHSEKDEDETVSTQANTVLQAGESYIIPTGDVTFTAQWKLVPPTADSKPSFEGLKVNVVCVDNQSKHELATGQMFGIAYNKNFTDNGQKLEDNGDYTYSITIDKSFYINKFSTNYAKAAHTETKEQVNPDITWRWNGTEWELLNEKDGKGIVLTINVACEPKQTVNLVIYRNGDTSKVYKTVALDPMAKGTVIDLSTLDINAYYQNSNGFEFSGWYNDDGWNEYLKNPTVPADGMAEITVNGWTNIKCMVVDYETVSVKAVYDDDKANAKTIYTGKTLHGSNLVEFLDSKKSEMSLDKDGFTHDEWYNWDWYGHKLGSNDTVNGWKNVYVKYDTIYLDVNVYIVPVNSGDQLVPDEFEMALDESTLKLAGLPTSYTDNQLLLGTFSSKTAGASDADDYGFGSNELNNALDEMMLALNPTGDFMNSINWKYFHVAVGNDEDPEDYLYGIIPFYSVRFMAGSDNVTGMPENKYTHNAVEIYDYYLKGTEIKLPAAPERKGYNFLGWQASVVSEEDEPVAYTNELLQTGASYRIPGGNVTFTAQWEPRNDTSFAIHYYIEQLDGSFKKNDTYYGKGTTDTTVVATEAHNKSYGDFTLDLTIDGTVPSGVITADKMLEMKLFFTRNTYDYTIEYHKQDATTDASVVTYTLAETETLSGKFEQPVSVTPAADKYAHYTFDSENAENKLSGTVQTDENPLVLKVYYKLDNHTLHFDSNGGSAVADITVRHGVLAAAPTPVKDNYDFVGWYTTADLTTAYDFTKGLEADATVYAKWEPKTYTYTVRHFQQLPDGTYNTVPADTDTLSGKYDTLAVVTAKAYAHFPTNDAASKQNIKIVKDLVIDVYYNLDSHTLTFDSQGGTAVSAVTVRHGNAVAKPAQDPVRPGYRFDGWFTDTRFTTLYDFSQVLTSDVTVYAKWTLIIIPGTLTEKHPKLNTTDHFAYVQGYPNGTVKPTGNITRAETAAILFRLMDNDSRTKYYSTRSGMRDVAAGSWYNTYVATLNNAGVITDSANGYFRPNDAITRAELAAMLAQFADQTRAANYFTDVSANYWAASAIALTAKLGWINGYPDGTFRPDKNVTRAELMAMINRATGRAPKSADAFLPGMKTWTDNANTSVWYYLDVQEATNSHTYSVRTSVELWTGLTADPNWSKYE